LLNIFLNIDNVVDNVCLYAGSESTEAVASAGITVAGSLVTALSSPAVIVGLVVLGIGMGVGAAYYTLSGVTETAATTATTFVEINNITDAIGLLDEAVVVADQLTNTLEATVFLESYTMQTLLNAPVSVQVTLVAMVALFLHHYDILSIARYEWLSSFATIPFSATLFLKNWPVLNFSKAGVDIFSVLVADGTSLAYASIYLDITKQSIDVLINKYKLMYLQNIDSYYNLKTEFEGNIIKVWGYYYELYYGTMQNAEVLSKVHDSLIFERLEMLSELDTNYIEYMAYWKSSLTEVIMLCKYSSEAIAIEILQPLFEEIDLLYSENIIKMKSELAVSMDKQNLDIIRMLNEFKLNNNEAVMNSRMDYLRNQMLFENELIVNNGEEAMFELFDKKADSFVKAYIKQN
jgi:hypothetical protein